LDDPDERRAPLDAEGSRQPGQKRRVGQKGLDGLRLEAEELERSEQQQKEREAVTEKTRAECLELISPTEVEELRVHALYPEADYATRSDPVTDNLPSEECAWIPSSNRSTRRPRTSSTWKTGSTSTTRA